ncbi:hypothetical protein GCM10008119_19840 [Pedobacter mendelii]|uniref:Uncharacterized protein n=1 Tax=Pedobacter mendelii TaxID=1908240 RepID=A0ABQ2BKU4_9SPHI|nr:hypothetical protein GCM10008119_19840 [Pedobacter mendelii]
MVLPHSGAGPAGFIEVVAEESIVKESEFADDFVLLLHAEMLIANMHNAAENFNKFVFID